MRVDALALALRPRSMNEAADLGAALLRAYAQSVWGCFLPVYGAFLVLALATLPIAGWLPMLLIFLFKPWLDRTLLFTLSRAAFGQATCWADLWRARRAVWGGQWFRTLLARFSWQRAYLQPVLQLEGQSGKALRQRRNQLLQQRGMAAFGLHFVFSTIEMALYFALLALGIWVTPEGSREDILRWLADDKAVLPQLLSTLGYALVIGILEPFYVAGGFCMYLNRRVELEAWDVEQALRASFASSAVADGSAY